MRRYAQTALLLLLGGMLLKLAVTGSYARYVGAVYGPLLVVAGLGLLAVAGVTLWHDILTLGRPGDDDTTAPITLGGLFGTVTLSAPDRTGSQPVATEEPALEPAETSTVEFRERAAAAGLAAAAHEGFDQPAAESVVVNEPTAILGTVRPPSRHDEPAPVDPFDPSRAEGPSAPVIVAGTRGGWALLMAALAILVISPPALGTDPAARLGTFRPAGVELPALPAGDPVALSLVDFVRRAGGAAPTLVGRKVRLVGFVLAGPHGEPYLSRLVVGCCAAGARPVKVGLTGDLPGVLIPGAWVAVVGTRSELVDLDPVNSAPIPYLSVLGVTDLQPPTDPYER
jgi:uncharacterized repeat protein (TIGR03943 family)